MSRALAGALVGLHALKPEDPDARDAIFAHFGLARGVTVAPATASDAPTRTPTHPAKRPARPKRAQPYHAEPIPTDVERIDDAPDARPPWLSAPRETLPRTARSNAPPPPPIIAPARLRAILTELFAEQVEGRAPDMKRLVRLVAEGRLISHVPRIRQRGAAPRMLLLLDAGMAMDPFAQDEIQLALSVQRLFDPARIVVRSFAGAPGAGLRHPETLAVEPLDTWRGAAILVLSDWGVGQLPFDPDRATTRDWERSAEALAALGRSAILNPYGPPRWTDNMARGIAMIHWHEGLTLGQVRRVFARTRCR